MRACVWGAPCTERAHGRRRRRRRGRAADTAGAGALRPRAWVHPYVLRACGAHCVRARERVPMRARTRVNQASAAALAAMTAERDAERVRADEVSVFKLLRSRLFLIMSVCTAVLRECARFDCAARASRARDIILRVDIVSLGGVPGARLFELLSRALGCFLVVLAACMFSSCVARATRVAARATAESCSFVARATRVAAHATAEGGR